ncbi:hypothetical protein HAX54_037697 [Datura stramonium]|uniref:Uncharacterized protein n=1 Tax=Datura stramonium TaxID=4076 RepID=A0ABS8SHB8_DATST|nr:hypothetical protein [Datura stramonium]
MIYGRGPMPSGMQMVPMVLPDGQIGYVLQQPGVQAPPVDLGGMTGTTVLVDLGGGSSGGTGDDSNRGKALSDHTEACYYLH